MGESALFEVVVEELLVEEDVRVAEALVEAVLNLLHAAHDAVDVQVARCLHVSTGAV